MKSVVVLKVLQIIISTWVSGRLIYKMYTVYTVYLSLIRKVPITIYKYENIQLLWVLLWMFNTVKQDSIGK